MEIKELKHDLMVVTELVSCWEQSGIVQIEKDIVLEKLRTIYSAVKSMDEFVSVPQTDSRAMYNYPDEQAPLSPDSDIPCPEEDTAPVISPAIQEVFADHGFSEGETEAVPESNQKPDRKAILSSLYDDEPINTAFTVASHGEEMNRETGYIKVGGNEEAGADKPFADSTAENDTPVADYGKTINGENHVPVLGEVLNSDEQTLGEAYAAGNTIPDVAEVISSGQTTSLRKSIGLNDKFIMLRDLFGGNPQEYETAIDELDAIGNLDDAMLYIYDKYNWNPNSEGVKLLVDLLTRKLS